MITRRASAEATHSLSISGCGADRAAAFRRAFFPEATRSARAGATTSSAPTWSATFRSSGRASRRRRCDASGRWSPTTRGLLNAAQLSRSLGVSGTTIAHYLNLMVDLLLVRRLPPRLTNVGKRLVRSPKLYVGDSGLLHALRRDGGDRPRRALRGFGGTGLTESSPPRPTLSLTHREYALLRDPESGREATFGVQERSARRQSHQQPRSRPEGRGPIRAFRRNVRSQGAGICRRSTCS